MRNKILTIFLFTILLATQVNAFGVTSFFYEGRPLLIEPGSTKDVSLILQNEQTSPHINVKAELTTNSHMAELTGKTIFSLESGANNIHVPIEITIPETAQIGEEYTVGVSFTTVADPGNKMLEMGTRISKGIPVVVGRVIEPEKSIFDIIPLETIGGIAIILVLAILIISVIKHSKKATKKKKKR